MKCREKFVVVQEKESLSLVVSHLKSDLNSKNTATMKELNLTEFFFFFFTWNFTRRNREFTKPLQASNSWNKLTTSKHSTELSMPFKIKGIEIDLCWKIVDLKCKKGTKMTTTANSFRKIDEIDGSARRTWANWMGKLSPLPINNQIAEFVEFCQLKS